MRIQVKDFMSAPVVTAIGEKKVSEIRALMERKNIHALPIISYSKKFPATEIRIRGIITTTDLSKKVKSKSSVEDIMTSKVHVIHKNSSAAAAAAMMLKHNVHHLVVMEDGKIIGMVSSTDFVKLVAQHELN